MGNTNKYKQAADEYQRLATEYRQRQEQYLNDFKNTDFNKKADEVGRKNANTRAQAEATNQYKLGRTLGMSKDMLANKMLDTQSQSYNNNYADERNRAYNQEYAKAQDVIQGNANNQSAALNAQQGVLNSRQQAINNGQAMHDMVMGAVPLAAKGITGLIKGV